MFTSLIGGMMVTADPGLTSSRLGLTGTMTLLARLGAILRRSFR
jgi:hypothetical protein